MIATQQVSVIPHSCVNGASSPNRERSFACTSLLRGAAPEIADFVFFKYGRFLDRGDMMMARAIGGTRVRSVQLNLSVFSRNCSREKRRIM
jgi:hypothetical protein